MRASTIALLAAVALMLLAHGERARAQSSPLGVTLYLDKSAVELGTPIRFTIRVVNLSNAPVVVSFASAQRFDLVIQSTATVLDRWSNAQAFAQVTGQRRWAVGEAVTYEGTWLPRSPLLPANLTPGNLTTAGPVPQPLGRGIYRVQAQLTGIEVRPVSQSEPLIIGVPTTLAPGCTTLPELLMVEVPVSILLRAVEPPEALHALWQRSPLGRYQGYYLRTAAANDLLVINTLYPVTICMVAPGYAILP